MHDKGNNFYDVALCQNAFDWEINMYGVVLIQEPVNDESYSSDMIYRLYIFYCMIPTERILRVTNIFRAGISFL